MDITKEDQCKGVVDNIILRFSRIDVLINNAAIDAKFDKHSKISMENEIDLDFSILGSRNLLVNLIKIIILRIKVLSKKWCKKVKGI